MKAWVLIGASICLPRLGFAAAALPLSYDQLEQLIRRNNKSIQSSLEETKAARERVGTIEQSFLPKLGAEAGIAGQHEANGEGDAAPFWKLDVQANLYRGGRDRLGVLVRDSQVLVKEVDTQAQVRAELFKAKLDYIRLNAVRRALTLTQASLDDYEGIRKSILRKAEAGLMTTTSAQAIQLEVDELRRQLTILSREEAELEDRLSLVLGLPAEQKLALTTSQDGMRSNSVSQVSEADIQNLPEVKRFELLSKSTSLESSVRNEWWLPDVSVFAAYTGFRVEKGNELQSLPAREMSLGLRFSIDLESKRALDRELVAKKSEMASYQLEAEYLKREVAHKVHEFNREIEVQSELLKTYEKSVSGAEKLLKQMRAEFERGIGSNSDITSIIRSLYQLKRNRIDAVTDYYLAAAGLETMTTLKN